MEESAYHSLYEREMTHWFCTTRREVIRGVLGHQSVKDGRVLEIGSGTGGNIGLLREYGTLTCIEPSETGRTLTARREGTELTVLGGLWPQEQSLPHGEVFDLIALLDVLEHLPDDVASLWAVRDRLAPDGRVVITVPSYQWMWSNHDTSLHHFRRYTRRSLGEVLARAGLRPVRMSYFNTVLFPAAVIARFAFRMLRIQKSPGRSVPSTWLNGLLRGAFRTELPAIRRVNLPWGLSIIAVCEAAPDAT